MKIKFLSLLLLASCFGFAQTLTVEKIMRDPKWIGVSPSNAFWSLDSKNVFFNWNPQNNVSDSVYSYAIGGSEPQKTNYFETQK
jgi:hypothetical protein